MKRLIEIQELWKDFFIQACDHAVDIMDEPENKKIIDIYKPGKFYPRQIVLDLKQSVIDYKYPDKPRDVDLDVFAVRELNMLFGIHHRHPLTKALVRISALYRELPNHSSGRASKLFFILKCLKRRRISFYEIFRKNKRKESV